MHQRPFAGRHRTEGMHGIAAEGVEPEKEKHDTPDELQVEDVRRTLQEVIDERHAIACHQTVHDVAQCCSHPGDEAIPTSLVQCTLDA